MWSSFLRPSIYGLQIKRKNMQQYPPCAYRLSLLQRCDEVSAIFPAGAAAYHRTGVGVSLQDHTDEPVFPTPLFLLAFFLVSYQQMTFSSNRTMFAIQFSNIQVLLCGRNPTKHDKKQNRDRNHGFSSLPGTACYPESWLQVAEPLGHCESDQLAHLLQTPPFIHSNFHHINYLPSQCLRSSFVLHIPSFSPSKLLCNPCQAVSTQWFPNQHF